ncbi:MAG: transposase [Deltaproteobacteria bacterium]|nr:transposase [Deltaproteobacteria bacterium]MBW2681826.1 transposase [Deltaproteobacteria bacterium]
MIRIKDHKQRDLFDPWRFLSPKRRRMLDESWPGLFRQHLLDEMPVDQISPFFCEDFGRPGKELYTLLGALLFQQTMDLNDMDTVEQLSFNIQWHYALNITEESDSAKYISEKTLWSWRQVLIEHKLDQLIFNNMSEKLAKVFHVDTSNQRIDSVHIQSNMRRLGRIGIFSRTIHKFLINLKRHHQNLFDTISSQLVERYVSQKALSAFSMVKPSESAKTLKTVSADLYDLIEQFKDRHRVCEMHSYKLMQRVLNEQCNVQSHDTGCNVTVKKPKEIPSDSLQNPSDPDAAYSGHKGQGYQIQLMETFSRSEDKKEKEKTLNLITHVSAEKACEHDSNALMPAIEDTQNRELGPEKVLGDTLYGSDDNLQKAKGAQVELISPAYKGGHTGDINLSHFSFDDKGRVVTCPAGKHPYEVRYKKKTRRYSARFDLKHCTSCPYVDQCPVVPGKKNYFLRYSDKDYRLAERRRYEASEEFIDIYRYRAGVEATMSQYNALTGVKRLRIRGLKAVRYCATLKAVGLNLLRAASVRRARRRSQRAEKGLLSPFPFFKEQFYMLLSGLGKIMLPKPVAPDCYPKLAA